MSNPALSKAVVPPAEGDGLIPVPNTLRAKVGPRFGGVNPEMIAKAEQALKGLSSQFNQWLNDEITKLESARAVIRTKGLNDETGAQLYLHAHDLKGLGTTYEFPLVTRLAGTLCKLLEDPAKRLSAPMALVDAHIDAIRAAVRDNVRDTNHPLGRALAEEFEQRVRDYVERDKGSSTAP